MGRWFEEAVFYHMYPIGMTGAPRRNEQSEVTHRFPQLEEWLPHIASLGCTAIYIGPLFESTSHGYDTRDYRLVDRRLGDNDDFKHFSIFIYYLVKFKFSFANIPYPPIVLHPHILDGRNYL